MECAKTRSPLLPSLIRTRTQRGALVTLELWQQTLGAWRTWDLTLITSLVSSKVVESSQGFLTPVRMHSPLYHSRLPSVTRVTSRSQETLM